MRDPDFVESGDAVAGFGPDDPLQPKVLVADDDRDIRTLLAVTLVDGGYDVHVAQDGDRAFQIARDAVPDAIVLDVMMPTVDGLTVLRSLKGDPRTRHIPVILLTAKTRATDVWAGWEAGADHYLTKPFDFDELLGVVDAVVSGAEAAAHDLQDPLAASG